MTRVLQVVAAAMVMFAAEAADAEDAFFHLNVSHLELTEGTLPNLDDADVPWRLWRQRRDSMQPYAVLNGEGEVYVSAESLRQRRPGNRRGERRGPDDLAIRTTSGEDVTGRLFWPKTDLSGMAVVRFRIPAADADVGDRDDFYRAKIRHYENLLERDAPGAAWFRHQIREARKELKTDQSDEEDEPATRRGAGQLNDTFALFSGGRAVSENLQLDRLLPEPADGDETVDLASIHGVTVAEIDFKALTEKLDVELDPLAEAVPFDQHAVFLPSFGALVMMIDEIKAHGQPMLQVAEPQGEDAGSFARYERQLALSITGVARLLGPRLTRSVAVTGSDPYFRTGTDVAFLFEAVDPDTLNKALLAQIAAAAAEVKGAKSVREKVSGVDYVGFRSPGREICSLVATFGNVVAVTNSPYQLRRLANVRSGNVRSLAALPEYKFFRDRYRRGDPSETALVFLSDATIRRWCGPRWRILASRRVRDMAVIAELQATQMDRLAEGGSISGPIYTDLPLALRGDLTLSPDGVRCETVGSLAFMTPIAEMRVDMVTKAEAEAYERWRDGYERNWRGVFDPIALRVGVRPEGLSADLSVMPLIGGSRYRDFIDTSRGAKIAGHAGDPHETLVHGVLAVNKDSETVKRFGNFAAGMMSSTQVNPLGWLGETVAVYFDDDPLWREYAKVPYQDRNKFFGENLGRIPVALVADVKSSFQLTAFLTAVRAFVEQTAPRATHWESLSYKDEPYVRITPSTRVVSEEDAVSRLAIYYSPSPESLIITLSEKVLRRALDRRLARRAAKEEGKPLETEPAWLGESLCLKADTRALKVISAVFGNDYRMAMQKRSWANLPVLNEWRRRYPDQNPVKLHQRVWKVRLIDPAGGRYVWNKKWQTMQSSVYGHPGKPKKGPATPPLVSGIVGADFGVTFERDGLRARAELRRTKD